MLYEIRTNTVNKKERYDGRKNAKPPENDVDWKAENAVVKKCWRKDDNHQKSFTISQENEGYAFKCDVSEILCK